jgi:hypothetical protein
MNYKENNVNFKSADALLFSPNNELIVGDTISGRLYAFKVEVGGGKDQLYNLQNIDNIIAQKLGISVSNLRLNDMVIHPVSKEIFISVNRGEGAEAESVIVSINAEGKVHLPKLELVDKFDLPNIHGHDTKTKWGPHNEKAVVRSLSITDIAYHKGFLYVSGLTNADFSSTLHKIAYPFNDQYSCSNIEIYHSQHGVSETRAPIRAQTIVEHNNESIMIAAYTCTPIVTIPINDLKDKAKIKGKTVADVGYGNTPLDILSFKGYDQNNKIEDYVIVINKQRSAQLFTLQNLLNGKAINQSVGFAPGGVESLPIPLNNLIRICDYSDSHLLILRREINTGSLDLLNIKKGLYFRLSDHLSEFNMPDYQYPSDGSLEHMKSFQAMLLQEEGINVDL